MHIPPNTKKLEASAFITLQIQNPYISCKGGDRPKLNAFQL